MLNHASLKMQLLFFRMERKTTRYHFLHSASHENVRTTVIGGRLKGQTNIVIPWQKPICFAENPPEIISRWYHWRIPKLTSFYLKICVESNREINRVRNWSSHRSDIGRFLVTKSLSIALPYELPSFLLRNSANFKYSNYHQFLLCKSSNFQKEFKILRSKCGDKKGYHLS